MTAHDTNVKAHMNGYTVPAAVIALMSIIAGFIADAAEPVLTFVGGGAAVGAAFFCTFMFSFSDDPDYGHATGQGTVVGALLGAFSCSPTRSSAARLTP